MTLHLFCFSVEPGTDATNEPKFLVFYTMLVNIFSMFCFNCKTEGPDVVVKRCGTMATVSQQCKVCGPKNMFQWRSQPLVMGGYPLGNILTSFGILMSGVCISKSMLMFKHIGMSMISPRTFFNHQRKFLFPAILYHWEHYRGNLLEKLKDVTHLTWSGDGRFDSMGHNVKYGVYTMFCNTISKLVHFELLQVRGCIIYVL